MLYLAVDLWYVRFPNSRILCLTKRFVSVPTSRLWHPEPGPCTASKTKEAYLKSIGATHVVNLHAYLSELPAIVKEMAGESVKIIYDVVPHAETENAAYGVLAPSGKMIIFPTSLSTTLS